MKDNPSFEEEIVSVKSTLHRTYSPSLARSQGLGTHIEWSYAVSIFSVLHFVLSIIIYPKLAEIEIVIVQLNQLVYHFLFMC